MRRINAVLVLAVFAVATVSAQNFDREAFLDAESRFLARNYSLALERYDEFIRTRPDSPYVADARYRRAVTLYRLGRLDEAYAALSLVESRFRSTKYLPYIPFWKAVIEYDKGEKATAAARFESLAAKPPDTATLRQSLLYLGKASTALGKNDEAVDAFERLIESLAVPPSRIEDEPSALIFLSDLYESRGDYTRLIALWDRIDPSLLDAETAERVSLRAAQAYSALGQTEKAVPLFEKLSSSSRRGVSTVALQQLLGEARRSGDESAVSSIVVKAEDALRATPEKLAEFWLRVGSGAFNDGRLDLARSYFLRISALLPADRVPPDVPIYLAAIDAREGNIEGAYTTLKTAAPYAAGQEVSFMTHMGWYALQLSRWDDARVSLSEAVTAADASGDTAGGNLARTYLAYALYRSDRVDEALKVLSSPSLDLSSSMVVPDNAMRLRAELLRKSGAAAEALDVFQSLIELKPKEIEPRVALIALLFEKGRYDRVVSAASDFDQAFPDKKNVPGELLSAANYMWGVASAATGAYANAVPLLDSALAAKGSSLLGDAAPWAAYYRAWSLYRLSRFSEAKAAFDSFLSTYPNHEQAYSAAYLSAWSSVSAGDYRAAATSARKASELAASLLKGPDAPEALARAAYLEGTIRPFFSDWDGALVALDRALAARSATHPKGFTSYTVKAAFERGVVLDMAGRTDASDDAFALVTRNYPDDDLASEALYRRGELQYRAKHWSQAVDRFAEYRQAYPSGERVDAALYFGGLSLKASGKIDAGILLWERLLADYKNSRYRFPATFAVARAYREKQDWEASFRAYTSAIAEFGAQARAAGAEEEAETLRYLMAKLPEKAARLHTLLNKENGAATATGRKTALELARFYITESAQREAALPLLDEVIALRSDDPASAAEAELLKGDYYAFLESWERAADAYLEAASSAANAPSAAKTTLGTSVRTEAAPEALFKAARARLSMGKTDSAKEVVATLAKNFPSSTWTAQAKRLLEGNR